MNDIDLNALMWRYTAYIAAGGGLLLATAYIMKRILAGKGLASNSDKIKSTLTGSNLSVGSDAHGFIFGLKGNKKVYLPNDKEGHITIFGGSGKGKTSALLIPTLRAWDAPFLAIDISGDISKNVDCENKVIINPENPKESCCYNILHIIDAAESNFEKRQRIEQLGLAMIDMPANANDAQIYFTTTARKIFLGCFLSFYEQGYDFIEICKGIFFNDIKTLVDMIKISQNELALSYVQPLLGENEKNLAGAKNLLNDKIKLFADNEYLADILHRGVTQDKEVIYPAKLENSQIFIKISDKKQEYYSSFLSVLITQFLEYISGRVYDPKKDKRILIALDEFASIGHFDILSPFRKFRKNGANLCILTQSLADVDLVYSENERKVILDNSQYIVVLSANDNSTRDYFSALVGREEQEKKSVSRGNSGSSESVSVQREFAINPEVWKNFDTHLVVIHAGGYIKLKKNYYFNAAKKIIKTVKKPSFFIKRKKGTEL